MIKPWEQIAPGETWRGWWETGLVGLPALPVLAARGRQTGPTLLVTGGVHGDEYEGPAAIHALFDTLDTTHLRGRVLGVPVVNRAAWQARARTAPVDNLDLNRLFPGVSTPAASPTQQLAEVIFTTFVQACDVLIDLHSGGVRLVHLPMVGWYAGDPEAERLARGFGGQLHPWLMPDVPGVLSCEARRAGKIAIGAEWQGGARLDQAGAAAYVAGLQRTLAALQMLSVTSTPVCDDRPPIAGRYQQVDVGGLFTPAVGLGDVVTADAPLGLLRDDLGVVTAEVKAFRAGLVAALAHLALVFPGDRVAYIG